MGRAIWWDTHTHLFTEDFAPDRDEVVARALEAGVERMVLPNIDEASLKDLNACLDRYPSTLGAVGIHPCDVREDWRQQVATQEQAYARGGRYVAVGEIGLDMYWDKSKYREQLAAFKYQMEWALELNRPALIHARESLAEILDLLSKRPYDRLLCVIHAFSGNTEDLVRIMDLDRVYVGIGGISTYKNGLSSDLLRALDLDRTLLETDSPYLSPVPKRGRRNESAHVVLIGEHLARTRGEDIESVALRTTQAARQFFAC